jgi:Asp-tRNA(Asn)/Glu-tRNA(Gln) amidotransferase C subunit
MSEPEPTSEDLAALARALGLGFSRERLEAVLPEMRRLWVLAEQLEELPLDDAPAAGASGPGPPRP